MGRPAALPIAVENCRAARTSGRRGLDCLEALAIPAEFGRTTWPSARVARWGRFHQMAAEENDSCLATGVPCRLEISSPCVSGCARTRRESLSGGIGHRGNHRAVLRFMDQESAGYAQREWVAGCPPAALCRPVARLHAQSGSHHNRAALSREWETNSRILSDRIRPASRTGCAAGYGGASFAHARAGTRHCADPLDGRPSNRASPALGLMAAVPGIGPWPGLAEGV